MTIELAIRGAGIALGRTCFVEDLLAGGRLVAPFSIAAPTEEAFFVVVSTPRRETDVARAFREWLLTEASMGAVESAAVGGVTSLEIVAS
jgi:LysR family transcriptional regulator, glycine cleavage system transcriptional activator